MARLDDDEEVKVSKSKKELKAELKAKKKADKAQAVGIKADKGLDEDQEKGGSKAVVALVTIVIIVVWLAILALLVKLDVGGFGSSVLSPILKDVPYISAILPETKVITSEDSAYSTLDEAVARIKELEVENQDDIAKADALQETNTDLQAEVDRLQAYEADSAQLEKDKETFYNEVVYSDQAPDISNYKDYYEMIDPTNAAEIYKSVVVEEETTAEIEEYASAYSSMKAAKAAAIMEKMTDNLSLVAEILNNMSAVQRGAILGAMDPTVAASVTKIMEP